jgi:hypothetical protein
VLLRMVRFDRVLSRPLGSLLLVGHSGVGRRSTVTLAAYMHRMELVTPSMNRGYSLKSFRTDLKVRGGSCCWEPRERCVGERGAM